MKISVMVVDDEPLAREELSRLIRADKDFTVVCEACDGEDALRRLEENPDIQAVFLDIDMSGMGGIDVAAQLAGWEAPPLVVFATAYHQYALEAFDANAIDYFLKPYDPARIAKTLERIKSRVNDTEENRRRLTGLEETLARKGGTRKIAVHSRGSKDRIIIDPADVLYFHAKYAEVLARLPDRELIVNSTLKELLSSLDAASFAQTHKAYIVNLSKVDKVSPLFSGNFEIMLKPPCSEKIPLSRRYARQIKALLGNW